MACKFRYVEQIFRKNYPDEADRLTELGINTWKTIKSSGEFPLNKNKEYRFSKLGTKQRNRQDEIVKSLNSTAKIVYENKGEVRVNLLRANKVGLVPFQISGKEGKITSDTDLTNGIEEQIQNDAFQLQKEDAERAGQENDRYLFESKKNLKDLSSSTTPDIFGKTKIETPEEIRYEYADEIQNAIFAGTPQNITAKQALTNILNTGIFDKNSKEYELIHRMIISTKASIKLIDSKDMKSSDTYMQYNTVDNTIEIAIDNLGDVSNIKEGIEKFLHEVYHDRSLRILRIPKNASEQKLRDDLKVTYDFLKPLLEENFPHEMSSLEEFTAGMFSNKELEAKVEELIDTKKSFWDILTKFFRDLFGLDNSYDQLINQLLSLVDISDEIYTGKDTLSSLYNIGSTISNTKKHGLNTIGDDINKTLQDLINVTSRYSENDKYIDKLKSVKVDVEELLDRFDKSSTEYSLEAIKIFTVFMKGQINGTNRKLENISDIDSNLYFQMKVYNDTFRSMQDYIKKSFRELKTQKLISQDEYKQLSDELYNISRDSDKVNEELYELAKELVKDNNIFSEQYKETVLRYTSQYRQEGIKKGLTKSALDEYVNKQLSENRSKIQAEANQEFNELLDSPLNDISNMSASLNSEKDFNHPIISMFSRILDSVKHTYQSFIQPELLNIQEKSHKFLEGRRTESSDEVYKNLIEWSKDDEPFLISKYKIGFRDSFNELMNKLNSEEFKKDLAPEEYQLAKRKELKKWFGTNTVKNEKGQTIPSSKWQNDLSKLTQKEREYLEFATNKFDEYNKNYGLNIKSLKKTTLGVEYFRLPSQHKEMITHLKNANIGVFKELYEDTFKLRTDDTTQGELIEDNDKKDVYIVHKDLSGKEINYVPIHYRGKIDKKHQSIDIATLLALEAQNSIKFREKTKVHNDLRMFIDVIQENKFIKTQGVGTRIMSYFNSDGTTSPVLHTKEDNINLLKQLETMLNNRFYDKTNKYAGKIGNADVAKIEGFIRGTVSRASMALNRIGAPVNIIVGKSNTLLEIIKDPNLSKSNVINAEAFFFKNIGGTLDDLGRNVYKSLPNQLLMQYGGLISSEMLQNNFEKNKTLALSNGKPLYMFQEGGEHWIQAIHTMTILDAAKILDENGNYLDKKGDITTKENAASVLDISVLENGNITTSIKTPFYTTIDRMKTYQNGGSATLRSYIQSSLIKSQGQYSIEYQSELQRSVLGKALMHFKKHIISPGLNRWRGFATNAFAKPEDVILRYNEDLLRPDEGNYTTFVRFISRQVIPKIRKMQIQLLMKDWNEMDEWEKGNIIRTLTEIAIIKAFGTAAILFAGAASDDEDWFWKAASIARRVESDSASYYNPFEAWRVIKNPLSTLKFLEDSSQFLGSVVNYIDPLEEDRNEQFIKASKKAIKYVPGNRFFNSAKEQYDYLNH